MKEVNQEINNLRLVDIVNHYPVSVRLRNCILAAHEQGTLPFNTINDYISYGKGANKNLLKIKNLGKKTASELVNIIDATKANFTEEMIEIIERTKKLELVDSLKKEHLELKLVDIVRQYPVSVRLKNCILAAHGEGILPFETIGEYIKRGESANRNLFKIKNLGKKTAVEFIELIESISSDGLLGKISCSKNLELVEFLDEEYPGVFQPLIDMYNSTPETEISKIGGLEEILSTLQNRKDHAEMVWFKFSGETLESIGKSFGITRERVRQIIKKYSEYITDTNSAEWAEKSIRHLMKTNNTGNALPDNRIIDGYHPHLARSLVKNFSERNSGSLIPLRRVEVARALGLDVESEILQSNRWTLEKTLFEVRQFAEELGKSNLMPMQKDFIAHGRPDLRSAVGKFGGQSKVASLAGLTYQGQLVAPDGSRTYWTEERIGQFLHEVAAKEGHPGVMPTRREVRKHAEKPDIVITIFTKSGYLKQKTLTWYELAREHGLQYQKDTHMVTKSFIKAFVESLGDALYHLTPAEIFVLFEQQGISKAEGRQNVNRSFDNLVDAIQSGYLPREEV